MMKFKRLAGVVLAIGMLISAVPVHGEGAPATVCASVVLMDADTGQVLYGKNMHDALYPASITKVMTGMLALERAGLDETLVMSREAVFSVPRGAAHIALDTGEALSLEDAMYAMGVESANDAANGVAEHVSGSIEAFAALMNARAKELGALNTHFANPSGMENEDHYTTAYDMALILSQAVKTPEFNRFYSSATYTMAPTNEQEDHRYFHNSNSFFKGKFTYEGIIASKTGWTPSSRHTLATAAVRDGRTLVAVVMNSAANDDKYEDTMKLLDYGFDRFNALPLPEGFLPDALDVYKEGVQLAQVDPDSFGTLSLLLHDSLDVSDVAVDYHVGEPDEEGSLALRLDVRLKEYSSLMNRELGSYVLTTQMVPLAPSMENQIDTGELAEGGTTLGQKALGVVRAALLLLSSLAGLLAVAVVSVRTVRTCQIRKRNLERKRSKAKWAAQQMRSGE